MDTRPATQPHRQRRPTRPHRRPEKGPPSAALLFVPPLVLCAGAVGVAAAHVALGSPFGPVWAADLWSMVKTAITATLAMSGFSAYVHRNNRRAWSELEAHGGGDGGGGGALAGPDDGQAPEPRPVTRPHLVLPSRREVAAMPMDHAPSPPPAPTARADRRRAGTLTPVTEPHDDDRPTAPARPPRKSATEGTR